ncbi:hypothetical protein FXO38_12950 [Capsicum annuum]|nr:hypothetical protein FXO38_12950 [Capsicum annuum]
MSSPSILCLWQTTMFPPGLGRHPSMWHLCQLYPYGPFPTSSNEVIGDSPNYKLYPNHHSQRPLETHALPWHLLTSHVLRAHRHLTRPWDVPLVASSQTIFMSTKNVNLCFDVITAMTFTICSQFYTLIPLVTGSFFTVSAAHNFTRAVPMVPPTMGQPSLFPRSLARSCARGKLPLEVCSLWCRSINMSAGMANE